MPKLSVVIPTFNAAKYLPEALESVLNQTYRNFEIIVVDDGSTDDTKEVLAPYIKKIKYIYQNNAGPGSAKNAGIHTAKGEWIAFLDSDDYWEDYHLEELTKLQESEPDADLIYTGKRWVNRNGVAIKDAHEQRSYPKGWIFEKMFQCNYVSSSSVVLARRSTLIDLGGFNEASVFRIAEDYDMWLRLSANYIIASSSKKSVNYRRHDNNITLESVNRARGILAALNNAVEILRSGRVNENNHPDKIDIDERMKRAYSEACVGLFHFGYYLYLRKIGNEAIIKGYISPSLLVRWVLSYLPKKILNKIKRAVRDVRSFK